MNTLRVYDPFADVGIDQILRGLWKPIGQVNGQVRNGARAVGFKVDVTEQDDNYVVNAEIPGVAKDDIQVTIEGNQVTIAAEVKQAVEAVNGEPSTEAKSTTRVLRSERYHGALSRSFVLPVDLDEAGSTARYQNGVLQLTLKKKAALAGHKLTIQ